MLELTWCSMRFSARSITIWKQEIEPSPILSQFIDKELPFSAFQIVIGKEEIPITRFVNTVYARHYAGGSYGQ